MRHFLANVFLYVLVIGLLAGSALWAYVRTEQLVITRRPALPERPYAAPASVAEFAWEDFGRHAYRINCQNCHTADGGGRGMYPPVRNLTAHLDAAGGRDYLIDLHLYGLYTGTYGAPMPPMPELSDAEIAAVLNYILTAFAPAPEKLFLPTDVAARRGQSLSEQDVARRRPAVPSARELAGAYSTTPNSGVSRK